MDSLTARHEANHATTALWLGIPVAYVSTLHTATTLGKTRTLYEGCTLLDVATVLLMPALENLPNVGGDLDKVSLLVRVGGLKLSDVYRAASVLRRGSRFQRTLHSVELALYSRPFKIGRRTAEVGF